MRARTPTIPLARLGLAGCLALGGCVYHGGQSHTLDEAGTPQGITAISVPFQKIITPAPEPEGFSSTYHKMRLDQQRLARKQAEREAQARAAAQAAEQKARAQSDPRAQPTASTGQVNQPAFPGR
jgi:regulator of protease activity HflC (stomatin/prohibitin superfamily)